jgi:hypothetical protein
MLAAIGAVVVGALLLLAVDALFSLAGVGEFGRLSGWLAATPTLWLFADEFRAWAGQPYRVPLAVVCALLAVVVGTGAGFAVSPLVPPLGSGSLAALVGAVIYALLWHVGIRWAAGREGGAG